MVWKLIKSLHLAGCWVWLSLKQKFNQLRTISFYLRTKMIGIISVTFSTSGTQICSNFKPEPSSKEEINPTNGKEQKSTSWTVWSNPKVSKINGMKLLRNYSFSLARNTSGQPNNADNTGLTILMPMLLGLRGHPLKTLNSSKLSLNMVGNGLKCPKY